MKKTLAAFLSILLVALLCSCSFFGIQPSKDTDADDTQFEGYKNGKTSENNTDL